MKISIIVHYKASSNYDFQTDEYHTKKTIEFRKLIS